MYTRKKMIMLVYLDDSFLSQHNENTGVLIDLDCEDSKDNLAHFLNILAGLEFIFLNRVNKNKHQLENPHALFPFEQVCLYVTLDPDHTFSVDINTSKKLNQIASHRFNNPDITHFSSDHLSEEITTLTASTELESEKDIFTLAPDQKIYLVDLNQVYINRNDQRQDCIKRTRQLLTPGTKSGMSALIKARILSD